MADEYKDPATNEDEKLPEESEDISGSKGQKGGETAQPESDFDLDMEQEDKSVSDKS